MEIFNQTRWGTGLVNTVVSEEDLLAAIVCKPLFRLQGDVLEPDDSEPWPVGPKPVETPYGELDGEMPFLRGGVDLIYLGSVHAPNQKPVPWLDVQLQAGSSFQRTIRVFGDRHWVQNGDDLVPSQATPFSSMALGWDRAFGGEAEVESGMLPWAENPEGRGFYMFDWQATDSPLPNIENPDEPIRHWTDRPSSVGTGPYRLQWSLRQRNGIEIDEDDPESPLRSIRPTLFNNAHPDLIVPEKIEGGDVIRIGYARKGGDLTFRMPKLEFHAHVQLEHKHFLFPFHLDQIIVFGEDEEEPKVLLSYRVCFRYRVVPTERRATTVRAGPAPESLPPSYPIRFDQTEPWA